LEAKQKQTETSTEGGPSGIDRSWNRRRSRRRSSVIDEHLTFVISADWL